MKHFDAWPSVAAWAAGLLVLAGCSKPCAPDETGPRPLGIVFSTDTLGSGLGFRKAEAFSAYLVRYRGVDLSQPLDTLRPTDKIPKAFSYVDRKLFCNLPTAVASADPHSYLLVVPAARRSYTITDIVLQYGGVDNCSRSLLRLDALVNGQRADARQSFTLTK